MDNWLTPDMMGYMASVFTTTASLPQVIRVWHTRDTSSLSLWFLVLLTIGIVCWLWYGVMLGSSPMVWANSISLVLTGILLVAKTAHTIRVPVSKVPVCD